MWGARIAGMVYGSALEAGKIASRTELLEEAENLRLESLFNDGRDKSSGEIISGSGIPPGL